MTFAKTDSISGGGIDTARRGGIGGDPRKTEILRGKALRYLTRTGNRDIAPILGLAPAPRRRRTAGQPTTRPQSDRPCEICSQPFVARSRKQRTCSRTCGGMLGQRTKDELQRMRVMP